MRHLLLNCSSFPEPDAISYRLVLNALERSKDHDKAERANSVLDRFLVTKIAMILLETLGDLNKFPWPADDGCSVSGPNHETYAHFVHGYDHLYGPVSEECNELLKSAFAECCQKGFFTKVIWNKFCVAMGPGIRRGDFIVQRSDMAQIRRITGRMVEELSKMLIVYSTM